MEPFVGLTSLLAPNQQECDWRDIERYVTLIRAPTHTTTSHKGLGRRLKERAASSEDTPEYCAWRVACELARAYNGMIAQGGHTIALSHADLPMKHLTACTFLRPEWLPDEVEGDRGWTAHVPLGQGYPTLMLGTARRKPNGPRERVYMRLHRFVCWLARGPPRVLDHEVCHTCSNKSCVRPSHLRWDSHARNMQETAARKRRG